GAGDRRTRAGAVAPGHGRAAGRPGRGDDDAVAGGSMSVTLTRPAAAAAPTPRDASGVPQLTRSQMIATLAGVLSAMLLSALDQTIVGTAMPRVIADLHGFEQYAWVVTAYLVASTAVVPIVGKLSDLYGRKLFLLVGVGLFIVASALCGA